MPDVIKLDTVQSAIFEVSAETRTIRGLVLPYGVVGDNGEGKYAFSKGTVTWPTDLSRVKLLVGHDFSQAIGYATGLEDTDQGVVGTFKVARGPEGDRALSMAEDRVWDGLSAGIGRGAKFQPKDGVLHAVSADIAEVSQTPLPAFDGARITSVAASAAPTGKEPAMGDEETKVEEKEAAPVDLSKTITEAITAGFAAMAAEPKREVVPAGRQLQVSEPAVYRFDGVMGAHDFSADLIAGMGLGQSKVPDGEAYERVLNFMGEQLGPKFVATTDLPGMNPTGYRADMFVNEQRFTTPLYDAVYKGTLTDVTPFTFSKFNTASGLVGDHVQGVEPTPGTYTTATAATITPAPVSGKVHITREVADQGGNPQVSALIWDKIVYEYKKAMETKVAALLNAASPNEFSTALAVGANTVANLAVPIEQGIAKLNFIAGGNRFNYVAAHLDLYLALAGLKDGQSRPYFPIIGATNATGTTATGFASLDVAGTRVDPVWSLGTTTDGTAHKSYLIDTSAVYFWASAPTKLDRLREEVEGWDIGVWGYQAGIVSDLSGLLKITYDPS